MKCPNGCGQMEYDFEGIGFECPSCGKFIPQEHMNTQPKEITIIDELEELAKKWEEYGEAPDQACASELREVLESYE